MAKGPITTHMPTGSFCRMTINDSAHSGLMPNAGQAPALADRLRTKYRKLLRLFTITSVIRAVVLIVIVGVMVQSPKFEIAVLPIGFAGISIIVSMVIGALLVWMGARHILPATPSVVLGILGIFPMIVEFMVVVGVLMTGVAIIWVGLLWIALSILWWALVISPMVMVFTFQRRGITSY